MKTSIPPNSLRQLPTQSGTGGITTFPNASFLTDQIGAALLDDPTFVDMMANKILSHTAFLGSLEEKLYSSLGTNTPVGAGDPFDNIYISDLTPDNISTEVLSELDRVTGIRDKSAEFRFEDGED